MLSGLGLACTDSEPSAAEPTPGQHKGGLRGQPVLRHCALCEAAAAIETDAGLRGKPTELAEFYGAAERLKNVIGRLIR